MRLTLVLLTLNEIVGLKALFDKIPFKSCEEVFCIDGGSKDGTIEFLQSKGIQVHVQEKRGRGEAFKLAFKKASGDALIIYSPDGNEDPNDIPKFRAHLEAGADMVIATRMAKGAVNEEDAQFIKLRKWANNAFNIMSNTTWNRSGFITDTINGFRAITVKAWKTLAPRSSGYTIEYELSIRCFKKRLKIKEFPTHEGQRIDGREGSPAIKTGLAFLNLYREELFR